MSSSEERGGQAVNEHPEDFRGTTLLRQAAAHEEMVRGNPDPFIQMWSRRDPVSLFGAWGPCQTGWERLVRTFRWVGSRYSGGARATSQVEVLGFGDELAYTVGYEEQVASVDGAPEAPIRLRVTHIYRREDGEWRLVHRHADFAPPDQSPGDRPAE
jgi:ketosteroid isomerase-like protein